MAKKKKDKPDPAAKPAPAAPRPARERPQNEEHDYSEHPKFAKFKREES